MPAEYLTIPETADFLGVSEITVKRFIREKLIQSEDKDGEQRLLKDAVIRYKKIAEQFNRR